MDNNVTNLSAFRAKMKNANGRAKVDELVQALIELQSEMHSSLMYMTQRLQRDDLTDVRRSTLTQAIHLTQEINSTITEFERAGFKDQGDFLFLKIVTLHTDLKRLQMDGAEGP